MSGSLASQSSQFNLPLCKGRFPHLFCHEKHFNYIGDTTSDKFYLNFGEKNVDAETLQYLTEKRNSNQPWSFNEELIQYYFLGVLTHTTAWDRLWGVDVFLRL